MIKWGIISTGTIAHEFANDFPFVKQGKITAVASRTMQAATEFAEQYSIPKKYGSYEELLDDSTIDVVYIGTPHNHHYSVAVEAINAGKAVLCEKPLTHDLELSRALISHAREKNIYLMEAMWTYFMPTIIQAQQWLTDGKIGALKSIHADFGFNMQHLGPEHRVFNPELAGGSILDIGIYPIAFASLIMGEKPLNIQKIIRYHSTGVDEDVSLLFRYADVDARLHCSFRAQLPNEGLLIGEKGIIRLTDFWESHHCELVIDGTVTDTFTIPNQPKGWAYEVDAVNADLMANRKESLIMPHSKTLLIQELMNEVLGKPHFRAESR